jgi:hypothetical protein
MNSYTITSDHSTHPRPRHEIQCFYDAKLERCHPRSAIKIDFRLTNGLVSSYEYFSENDHVIDSTEVADDLLTVAAVL